MSEQQLREKILGYDDRQSEIVEVPEWGGVKLEIRSMSALERSTMFKQVMDFDTNEFDIKKMYPSMVIATAYDPDSGEKVFTDDDADALNDKNASAVEKVAQVAMRLSGMSKQEVEDLGKLSSPDTSDSMENEDSPST